MKKLILVAVLALPAFLYSQKEVGQKPATNAERFSDKAGTLIQKEYDPVGEVAKCKIQVLTFKDLLDGHEMTAIQFEYEHHASYGSDTKLAVLDADEVDAFMASIRMIRERVMPVATAKYTEVNFKSRGGFMAGCFSKKDKWNHLSFLISMPGGSEWILLLLVLIVIPIYFLPAIVANTQTSQQWTDTCYQSFIGLDISWRGRCVSLGAIVHECSGPNSSS